MLLCKRKLGWYMFSPHPAYWQFDELTVLSSAKLDKHLFKMKHCFKWIRIVVDKPGCRTAPLIIPTCVQVIKRMTGIRTGYCASGHGLFKQLLKCDNKTNYTIEQIEVKDGWR